MKGPVEMCDDTGNPRPVHGASNVDFSEYMWMAEEGVEEFDKKCEEEFWEQEFVELFLEGGPEEPQQQIQPPQQYPVQSLPVQPVPWWSGDHPQPQAGQQRQNHQQLVQGMQMMTLAQEPVRDVPVAHRSKLNPNAPEFVPRSLQPVADR